MVDDQLSVAERFIDALGRLDLDGMLAEAGDDIVFELPYAPPGLPTLVSGREAFAGFMRAAIETVGTEFEMTWLDVRAEADPERFIAEYTGRGTMKRTGKPYANTYVNLLRVAGGKVVSTKEFFNVTPLVTALDLKT